MALIECVLAGKVKITTRQRGRALLVSKITVYLVNKVSKQEESLTLVKHLKSHALVPWLCMEDFNEIMDHSEKEGAAIRRESQMEGFRTALEECQLCDLGYSTRPKITWSNKQKDATFTKERLDYEWCARFQVVSVTILVARTSDHNPVYVQFNEQPSKWQSYKRGFKFEDSWNTDEECRKIIEAAWDNDILGDESMLAVKRRLSASQQELSR